MTLSSGTRIGPYEILFPLGAGGMGEVYEARDTKLDRHVAIKILPDVFVSEPERVARFRREAKTLASLNHPNIAGIYGLEEAGDVTALVMELVDGEDLSERIRRGAIPLDEALPIAEQIALALEAAHEQGIIHRDLKPANIKLRPDGVVKVLDFGLAKLTEPAGMPSGSTREAITDSPTLTSPAMMTGVGVLLGTAAYMSPEQAKGRDADKRSDIWTFGAVLYEMLTGLRAFDGDDMTEVLGAVVRLEPDWQALPSYVPQPLRTLLQQSLVKDRRIRIGDIAVARFVLNHETNITAASAAPAAPLPQRRSRYRVIARAAAVGIAALMAGAVVWLLIRPTSPSVIQTTITTSGLTALTLNGSDRDVAITPDGSRVVYRGNNQLLVRALNQLEPTVLSGLGEPRGVFISPNGEWVGFFNRESRLEKVAITGGSPVMVGIVGLGGPRGATWGPDDTIIFATNVAATGLQRISAAGGQPTLLTTPERERGEGDHLWPEFLPGGGAVLFTITPADGSIDDAQIALLDLQTRTWKPLNLIGSHAQYVPTGHLIYGVAGTLRAVPFDLERLEVRGTPKPVLEGVVTTIEGAADITLAANGSLVYVPGVGGIVPSRTVMSVDRHGNASPLPGLLPDTYRDVRLSPDGARLALATQSKVWTYDFERTTLSPLTSDPARSLSPLWTADGQRVVFTSFRAGYPELFWRPHDGSGSDERLLTRAKDLLNVRADDWSPDGKYLLFTESWPSGQAAIGQMAIAPPSDVKVLVKSKLRNAVANVSPDGLWIAYESSESGQLEIYVERYPQLGSKKKMSTGSGRLPIWSRDGRELFFSSLDGRQMFAVAVQPGVAPVIGRPEVLFEFAMLPIQGSFRPYDVARDGKFLIIRSAQAEAGAGTSSNLILVQNWFEELNRLVPTN